MKRYVLINHIDYYTTIFLDGVEETIHFGGGVQNPVVTRRGSFKTSNPRVIAELEKHPGFGIIFQLAPGFKPESKKGEEVEKKDSEKDKDKNPTPPKTEGDGENNPPKLKEADPTDHPEFTTVQAARDFFLGLQIEGVTEDSVSNKGKLIDVALFHGHTFSGLKK